jgi:hypothetical protein
MIDHRDCSSSKAAVNGQVNLKAGRFSFNIVSTYRIDGVSTVFPIERQVTDFTRIEARDPRERLRFPRGARMTIDPTSKVSRRWWHRARPFSFSPSKQQTSQTFQQTFYFRAFSSQRADAAKGALNDEAGGRTEANANAPRHRRLTVSSAEGS